MADFLAYETTPQADETVFALRQRVVRDKLAYEINPQIEATFTLRLLRPDPFAKVELPVIPSFNAQITYYQRAIDVGGTGGYVYWSSIGAPDPTPAPSETTPNFTGTLQVYTIVRLLGCE